jgi:oxygen-independent coproporphyrinogen-3 oxidase
LTAPTPPEAGGFGIYIHWPFCLSKCPYCDFNSHVRERIDEPRWQAALLAELDHYAAATAGRTVDSIFFGGGTPSLMPPETAAALIERIRRGWRLSEDAEITLEANPTSVEAGRFRAFRTAGVNRVSLGLQALDDASLRFLGRRHSRDEALEALGVARAEFRRVSFDLIYARPGQTAESWSQELERAIALAGEHLSLYQLTIESGTAFATAHARGDFTLPDEDDAAALYELTEARLAAAGLPGYEVSNYARPGGESRHNLVYWRYGDYLGIGPGAHGRLTLGGEKRGLRQKRAPETWLAAVEAQGHGAEEDFSLTRNERVREALMMGLRLAEGVPIARIEREGDDDLDALIDRDGLDTLIEAGFLTCDPAILRATPAGRQRLNAVLAAFLL